MKQGVFLETYDVTALRNAVAEACDAGLGNPAMVMAYGDAGTGKTVTAKALYVELGGIYLRAFEGVTLAAFLQDLCFEADGTRPHGSTRCRMAILKALTDNPVPIFVDEADRLHISLLDALRDVHDIAGSPIVLIGEMGLPTRVSARSRINDRIPEAFRVHFKSIQRPDVAQYASMTADLCLTPEAAALVHTKTRGNFRRVHNAVLTLERAANASGRSDIDADFVQEVLNGKR